jgi:serpin B
VRLEAAREAVPSSTRLPKSEAVESPAVDLNAFALALYETIRARSGNLFFSTFSLRIALAMSYAGARGETAAQMREALCVSIPEEDFLSACAEMMHSLGSAESEESELAVANSLWSQTGAPLESAYLDRIARHFGGGVNAVDFRGAREAARVLINRWVEERTRDKILEIIPPDVLSADTRLALVNAIYFKATWAVPFDKALTRHQPFFLEDGGVVQTPLMIQSTKMGYLKGPDFQAVTLAYRGGLSMIVLLPDQKKGLRDLEARLSAALIRDCLHREDTCRVALILPRFKISWGTVDLCKNLKQLGMRLAFEINRADFSGINGLAPPHEESLYVSAVLHKAFVEVNEQGTEAAAASVVSTMLGAPNFNPPPLPVVRADHPFLFAICDRRSGAVIFMGRVVDPTRD